VKLRPYRQVSAAGQRVHKLSQQYYGPLKIIKAIGGVAFELQPPTSKIHHVFHVSKLKPCSRDSSPSLELLLHDKNNQPIIQPVAILNWQKRKKHLKPKSWSNGATPFRLGSFSKN